MKRSISESRDIIDFLKNPGRKNDLEDGGALLIENMDFSTEKFSGLAWSNIKFINCDFSGDYLIDLIETRDVSFERCHMTGVLTFGDMINILFKECTFYGRINLLGGDNSRNVVFESCQINGNRKKYSGIGAIGTSGESTFSRCHIVDVELSGYKKLLIVDSTLVDTGYLSEKNSQHSVCHIQNSTLKGNIFFGSGYINSILLKKCQVEMLSFRNTFIDDYISIENCTFKSIDLYVEYAKQVTMRNSTVYGDGRNILSLYTGAISHVVIDSCEFGSYGEENIIAGGIDPDDEAKTSKVNKTIEIRNSAIPILSSVYVNSPSYTLEGCMIDAADFNHSRFGSFTIKNTKINRSINFTATQAKVQDIAGLYGGGLSLAQVEDSNIKLPR